MISEGSCDNEDGVMMLQKIQLFHHRSKSQLKSIKIENSSFKLNKLLGSCRRVAY